MSSFRNHLFSALVVLRGLEQWSRSSILCHNGGRMKRTYYNVTMISELEPILKSRRLHMKTYTQLLLKAELLDLVNCDCFGISGLLAPRATPTSCWRRRRRGCCELPQVLGPRHRRYRTFHCVLQGPEI